MRNRAGAASFTPLADIRLPEDQELAAATPVYAELQSLFDLTVLAALVKREQLAKKVGWKMELFLDGERATIVKRNVPHQVPSVSNYKVLQGQTFVAQVSGGVVIDPWALLKEIDAINGHLTATFAEDLGVTAIFVDRDGRAHDDPSGLLSGLAAFTLPPDEGHAYLFGEFHVMRAVKTALVDRGLTAAQISLKAFYRIGQSNGPNGEPDKEP